MPHPRESLPLQVPDLRPGHDPSVERDPERVRAWAAELPLLNPVACLDALLGRLEPLAREPLNDRERFPLAEAYRPAVRSVIDGFGTRALRRLPLTPEARAAARSRLVPLCQALAANYKRIVRDAVREGRDPAADRLLARACFRALEHTGWVIAAAWRARTDPPPFTWLELHQLYGHAVRHGLEDLQPPPEPPPPPAQDLGALYRLWLVAAAVDPYRLDDEEQTGLLPLLAPAAARCRLEREPCPAEPGRLGLDPGADSPPVVVTGPKGRDGGPLCLDARPVLEQLERLAEAPAAPAAERALAQRALAPLRPGDRRGTARRAADRPVLLARGLAALCALAAMPAERIEELVQGQRLGMSVLSLESDEESAVALDEWRVVNESVRGLMAVPARAGLDPPAAGEPVAVVEREQEGTPWRVQPALVRWVRDTGGGTGPAVGLERLPGRMAPVRLEGGPESEGIAALYLGPVPALRLPARLLCPPDALDPAGRPVVDVHIEGRHARARVAGALERTVHVAVLTLARA